MKKHGVYFFMFFFGCLISVFGAEVKIIKYPAPIFSGLSNAKTLVLEKSIEDIGNKKYEVFAGIQSIAVERSGNYYILDYKHKTVIKLNDELKYLDSIGKQGEGPGEFKIFGRSPNTVSVGLDEKLYVVNFMSRRIKKFSLDGKYILDFTFQQFFPFKVIADDKGNLYLPSTKGYIIDVYGSDMKYKKSLLPGSDLKTFLFFERPDCVIMRHTIPGLLNIKYDWLSTKEMVLLNQYDLSITILNPETRKIAKKFYAWDDFILSEFRKKEKKNIDKIKKTGSCSFVLAFLSLFIDHEDNICLQFLDSQNNQFLYKFSSDGELRQMYEINPDGVDGISKFFQIKENKFYSYSNYAIHIFREKIEKK